MPTDTSATPTTTSRGNLALGLGLAALVTWVIAVIVAGDNDEHGWLWVVMAALGLGALVAGLSANPGRPHGRALVGTVIGGLLVLLFLGFVIAGD
jgi:FtsH-binding integral membrane protein